MCRSSSFLGRTKSFGVGWPAKRGLSSLSRLGMLTTRAVGWAHVISSARRWGRVPLRRQSRERCSPWLLLPSRSGGGCQLRRDRAGIVGEFAQKPSEIVAIAARWLGDPETLFAIFQRALCIERPIASVEIAGDVIEVARAKMFENLSILERQ